MTLWVGTVFFMRRGYSYRGMLGPLMIVTGVTILLAMVLPAGFWWFLLATGLIVTGLWLCRR